MCHSAAHNSRPARESLRKRLGATVAAALALRDGAVCVYCGATEASSGAHLHLDHVRPELKGTAAGDCAANLVTACRRCNSARQTTPLGAWCVAVGARTGEAPEAVRARVKAVLRAKLDLAAAKAALAAKKA